MWFLCDTGAVVRHGIYAGRRRGSDRDGGRRVDILSSDEREELRRLRKENRQFRQERDILSKTAAWFAQNDVTSPRSSGS